MVWIDDLTNAVDGWIQDASQTHADDLISALLDVWSMQKRAAHNTTLYLSMLPFYERLVLLLLRLYQSENTASANPSIREFVALFLRQVASVASQQTLPIEKRTASQLQVLGISHFQLKRSKVDFEWSLLAERLKSPFISIESIISVGCTLIDSIEKFPSSLYSIARIAAVLDSIAARIVQTTADSIDYEPILSRLGGAQNGFLFQTLSHETRQSLVDRFPDLEEFLLLRIMGSHLIEQWYITTDSWILHSLPFRPSIAAVEMTVGLLEAEFLNRNVLIDENQRSRMRSLLLQVKQRMSELASPAISTR